MNCLKQIMVARLNFRIPAVVGVDAVAEAVAAAEVDAVDAVDAVDVVAAVEAAEGAEDVEDVEDAAVAVVPVWAAAVVVATVGALVVALAAPVGAILVEAVVAVDAQLDLCLAVAFLVVEVVQSLGSMLKKLKDPVPTELQHTWHQLVPWIIVVP